MMMRLLRSIEFASTVPQASIQNASKWMMFLDANVIIQIMSSTLTIDIR